MSLEMDIRVQEAMYDALKASEYVRAAGFETIQIGVERDLEAIPNSQIPALRIGWEGFDNDNASRMQGRQAAVSRFPVFVVVRATNPQDAERRILKAVNAVMLCLQNADTLGGLVQLVYVDSATRSRLDKTEGYYEAVEISVDVLYVRDYLTGLATT